MKNKIIYFFVIIAATLTSCDKELHEIPTDKPTDEAVVTVSLNKDSAQNTPLKDVHLYWFDETDKLYKQDYYPSMEDLARARITLPEGSYTVFAVLNVGTDFSLPSSRASLSDIDLSSFSKYVKDQEGNYTNMLTGTLRNVVKNGTQLVYVDLQPKSSGIENAYVKLLLTIPSPNLPDFGTKATATPALRGTAFIFKKGSKQLFAVKQAMLTSTGTDGVYSMDLSLFKGEYDVNLWCDYTFDETTDNNYITTGPDVITIQSKNKYVGNTDTRDCFSKRISLTVEAENNTPQSVEMQRPLAKYRLVATDVAKYEAQRLQKGLPALADLRIFIGYEGFLPSAYNITESKLADAKEGYFYYSTFSGITTADATIAKDYVLMNGTESSVVATILFKDAAGNTISGVRGVKIAYRAGQLTTVSGDFLTAGLGSGVTINTEWSGDHNVEF
jgi:hypothetical protein